MKIFVFPASSSNNSINKRLGMYAAALFEQSSIEQIDLKDYEVEIFSVDKEADSGVPNKIEELAHQIDRADLLVISLAEQNGSYSAAFKNSYDWLSRIPNRKVLGGKPVLLLATSLGESGGSSELAAALDRFTRDGSRVLDSFSLPNFHAHFVHDDISTIRLRLALIRKVNLMKQTCFKTFYKNDNFTCGIDPDRNGGCGDAIEY
jgi:chromate reductase